LILHENGPAHRPLPTQKELSKLDFKYLNTHPILRIWPRGSTTCSLDWKTIEISQFWSEADVIVSAETSLDWQIIDFLFECLSKVWATA
jgi:hypothetical protein